MATHDLVSFRRTDRLDSKFEAVVLKIADHFSVDRNYLRDFCQLIKHSSRWDKENLEQSLNKRLERFEKASKNTKTIVGLIREAFMLCESDGELGILRGALLEALLIGAKGGSAKLKAPNVGWGAKVYINGNNMPIRYQCPLPQIKENGEKCESRATVDYGEWNGYSGRFYECKVQPVSIGCKEKNYMVALSNKLADEQISHELFFVCAESEEAISDRLKELDLPLKCKAVGPKELRELIKAIANKKT